VLRDPLRSISPDSAFFAGASLRRPETNVGQYDRTTDPGEEANDETKAPLSSEDIEASAMQGAEPVSGDPYAISEQIDT
jgi:hypothetical protein